MLLDELRVTNLALIAEATVEFAPGLNVITGETGAGKTLLLGALRLLRGESASQGLVGATGDAALVEARFEGDAGDLVLTRRLSGGRSRAYLDGSMVPARTLAECLDGKVEIVGQHDHTRLTTRTGLRDLLDSAIQERGVIDAYATAWALLTDLRTEAALLGGDRRALRRELEMVRFEADEIAASGFSEGEDQTLETAVARLRNAGALIERLDTARGLLADDAAAEAIEGAARALTAASRIDRDLTELGRRAEALASDAASLAADIAREAAELDGDAGRLQAAEERIVTLNTLRRKYGDTLGEVLEFGRAAATRAEELGELLAREEGLAAEIASAEEEVIACGEALRDVRRSAAKSISEDAVDTLTGLGFDSPLIEFSIAAREPAVSGLDEIDVVFASDASLPPGPLRSTASGGELSRAVLAMRLAAGGAAAGIVAFDEVDAGIGGRVALEMGRKLSDLAATRQVLCVTHLPQLAAYASRHVVVTRDGATAGAAAVEGASRVAELTRMLAGLPDSEKGREHAEELLAIAGQ